MATNFNFIQQNVLLNNVRIKMFLVKNKIFKFFKNTYFYY